MKILKFLITILTTAVIVISLTVIPACAAAEPEVTEEPSAEEETEVEEEPEVIEEEAVEGEPELLWSFEHKDQEETKKLPDDFKLDCLAASPDGETLVVGSSQDPVKGSYVTTYTHLLYDGSLIDVNTSQRITVDDVDFSPDGSVMGFGFSLFGTVLIDAADGSKLLQLHNGRANHIAFSPDSEHVATGNQAGVIWIWRIDDGEQVAALENPEIAEKKATDRWVIAIDYHPSGELLAATHNDGTVYIWDLEEESIVHTIALNILVGGTKNTFRFSPDGQIMAGAVGGEDREYLVRLWAVDNYEQLAELVVPGEVSDIAFSPDGSLLAVASHAGAIGRSQGFLSATTIWDIQSKTLLYTLDQEFSTDIEDSDWLVAVVFTPDGGHLAVARWDGPLELWRLPGAEPLEAPGY
jgi:WD40 repeat protein